LSRPVILCCCCVGVTGSVALAGLDLTLCCGKLLVENGRNCSRWRLEQSIEGKRFQTFFFEIVGIRAGRLLKSFCPSVRLYANEARAAGRVFVQCGRPSRHFSEIWRRISNRITKVLQYRVFHKKTHSLPHVCRTKVCRTKVTVKYEIHVLLRYALRASLAVFKISEQQRMDVAGIRSVFISYLFLSR